MRGGNYEDGSLRTDDGEEIETEVSDLRKKYRVMEGSKKQYAEESRKILRQQKAIIDKIKAENDKLKEEIATQSRFTNSQKELTKTEDLFRYSEEVEKLYVLVENEKKRKEKLHDDERHLSQKIIKTREMKKQVTRKGPARSTSPLPSRNSGARGAVETMENRVAKISQKYNEIISNNKRLRKEIDDLRKARVSASDAFEKIVRQLEQKREDFENAMEEVRRNNEKKNELLEQLEKVRDESDADQADFIREYRRMGDIISGETKENTKLVGEHVGGMSPEEEEELKKKVSKQRWKAGKNRAYHATLTNRVKNFEEAFKRISEATGIEDVDDFVESFINEEDGSFHTIKHINMLEGDIKRGEAELSELTDEIEKIRKEQSSSEESWKQRVQKMQDKVDKLNTREEELTAHLNNENAQLDMVKDLIARVWKGLQCNKIAAEMSPSEIKVDEVLNFLGVIEQRVAELLLIYSSVLNPAGEGGPAVIGRGPLYADEAGHVTVVPPSIAKEEEDDFGDMNDEDGDEDMPIPLDKLKQKALQGIQKNTAAKRENSMASQPKRRTSVSKKVS
mmetsp:Transcript_3964/g.7550  ORF Transcript_3964/g.7550 Transcript_3964/m.7550 type:complete len:565 (-) Transcript_3964:445-2139(-)